MAQDVMETVKKRLRDGWIKAWLAVEVLAVEEDAAETSLRKHIEKIDEEEDCIVYKQDYKKTERVKNPFKDPPHAYSKVVEIELVTRRFEHLIMLVLKYAPSSVEVLEPAELKLKLGEAQGILNTLAEMIHHFAMSQRGAVMIDT